MFEISRENEVKAYFKIRKLPMEGILKRNGIPMVLGSKFTLRDVSDQKITYTHTGVINALVPSVEDYFEFSLWDPELGDIKLEDYSACLPWRDIETPIDGVFRFNILVVKRAQIVVLGSSNNSVLEKTTVVTARNFINVEINGRQPDEIVHTIVSTPRFGYFTLRGKSSRVFTQADVNGGDVRYVNLELGSGSETLDISTCTLDSQCLSWKLSFNITQRFSQNGDNLIYASTGSTFSWEFTANTESTLWELLDSTTIPPQDAVVSEPQIIDWSSYTTTSDQAATSPNRGPGFDKLVEFRNRMLTFYWKGGLPTGVTVTNTGTMYTSLRTPPSQAGTQHWRLPNEPTEFEFTLKATDPKSGQIDIRKYKLIVTDTGLSAQGLASESAIL